MRTPLFKPSPSTSPARSIPHRQTFSDTLMDENIENAQELISKWDVTHSSSLHCDVTNLFASDNRYEARQYLNSIKDLQIAMRYYFSQDPTSDKLVLAQNLMQIAMKRLEKEFYIILKSKRQHLDPESVSRASRSSVSEFDDESEEDGESRSVGEDSISEVELVSMAAMEDLKAIAECMIGAGYGKECVKIFKIIRKSIVDEALYHLMNFESRLSLSQIQKMDWEVLEVKIKTWLNAVKVAVKTLFYGERVLCDKVFSSSPSMKESCFADITREGALSLFVFPENVAKCKKAPERIFRTLDLYEAIADLWTEIEPIFDLESTSTIRKQAINSLIKLGEAALAMLTEFETAISKFNSKAAVPGGGIHPLTRSFEILSVFNFFLLPNTSPKQMMKERELLVQKRHLAALRLGITMDMLLQTSLHRGKVTQNGRNKLIAIQAGFKEGISIIIPARTVRSSTLDCADTRGSQGVEDVTSLVTIPKIAITSKQ